MATPKSAVERVQRKVRLKKPDTPHDDHNMTGRVVVKKTGNNDPRRNKPKLTTEGFLNFYLGKEKPADTDMAMVVLEKLIKYAMHFEGKMPFKIARLMEMKESLREAIIEEVEKEEFTATFKITSKKEEVIKGVWRMLKAMEMLGGIGASRTVSAGVDGDGSFRMKLEVTKGDGVSEIDEIDVEKLADKDEIKIDLFGGKIIGEE